MEKWINQTETNGFKFLIFRRYFIERLLQNRYLKVHSYKKKQRNKTEWPKEGDTEKGNEKEKERGR